MSTNEAAWITAPAAYPFVVESNPNPKPGPGEVVIKNTAVAINPVDWKIQNLGRYLTKYPFILGEDAAGIVEDVGCGVSRFTKGQRVIAHCNGLMTQDPANSAFQLYPLVTDRLIAELPDFITFEQGVVLPLAISTACAGLYRQDYLNLPLPQIEDITPTGNTLLVWGGASSVDATAIQLAVASGLTVITTASSSNHGLAKSLGASLVFDYRSPAVVEDITQALHCLNTTLNVANVLPYDNPTDVFAPKYVVAYSIIQKPHDKIGEWIWGTYVPKAMAKWQLQAKPGPFVVATGIESIQHGLDVQQKDVSAKKLVVTL